MSEQRDAAVVSSEVEAVVTVEFCGETFPVSPGEPLVIGREGDVEVDDNPYLHRSFLQVEHDAGLWWLRNVGSTLTATVADPSGAFQAWLAPGSAHPARLRAAHRVVHGRPHDLRAGHRRLLARLPAGGV